MDDLVDRRRLSGGSGPAARRVGLRLAAMLFLQYAMWGLYSPYVANYMQASIERGGLGYSGGQVGWVFTIGIALGAVAAPLIAGQLADRVLNAERALALLLAIAGVTRFALAYVESYGLFFGLSIVYALVATPTASLTNSLCFRNLDDPEARFPRLRVWGTIGWIVAANVFPLLWLRTGDAAVDTARVADGFRVSGVLSVLYAVYCVFVLPKTPPSGSAKQGLPVWQALRLFARPGFLVLAVVALPLGMVQRATFIRIGPFLEDGLGLPLGLVGPAQTIGQASEVLFLVLLGGMIYRLGYRWTLVIGAAAFVVQSAVFALGQPIWLAIAALALAGTSFACFFTVASLYVDRVAPPDSRHSAQMVFNYVKIALAPICTGFYNQYFDRFAVERVVDGVVQVVQPYTAFWWTQGGLALIATVGLAVVGHRIRVPKSGRHDEA